MLRLPSVGQQGDARVRTRTCRAPRRWKNGSNRVQVRPVGSLHVQLLLSASARAGRALPTGPTASPREKCPKAPPRPAGVQRNLVISLWDWGTPIDGRADSQAADLRNPRNTANGQGLRRLADERRADGARSGREQHQDHQDPDQRPAVRVELQRRRPTPRLTSARTCGSGTAIRAASASTARAASG